MLAMKTATTNSHQQKHPPNGLNNNAANIFDPSTAASPNWPSSASESQQNGRLPPAPAPARLQLNGLNGVNERRASGRFAGFPPGLLSEEDLEGGQLLNVEEREEIDPEDGCKIQVWTYHILSADGMEESTITKRRKLKVNCTQSLKRVEFTNGRETKYEERAVMNNLESLNENPMLSGRSAIESGGIGPGGEDEDDSKEISNMLLQTQDNFLMLLREKKDALVKMFPELFSNLRTLPAIFELMPSTVQETVVNEDGSTTTRTKSSKAFSSHYTRQETFINGVRRECKSRFRAFMEYAGPEGGFCIRLNDNPEADLSEDEELGGGGGSGGSSLEEDGRSRISRSAISELGDAQSALVVTGAQGQLCLLEGAANKDKEVANRRWEKAWHAVNEMVESEERYVQKLALLNRFRTEVERARVLDKRQMGQLFANIASLHQFHEQHLLPQLMDRRREWQGTKRISDVLRKQAPFLKMYSEYTNNYKLATQIFEDSMRKKRQFDEIVKRIEHLPECEHLSLVSHLICPVQRVMRYQLLLKEYQKHLNASDPDWRDTETALSLVLEAASHANEMMRKLDRYRNVLEVQEQLGNCVSLVSPGRELLTRCRLFKCSSSTGGKVEERLLFAFNDLFLLASERTTLMPVGIGGGTAKYRLRAIFAANHTQICEGDNLELENSFYMRGADSEKGPQRCVELFCSSQKEKNFLFDTVWAVIQEAHSQEAGAPHSTASLKNGAADQQKKSCARCDTDFGWYTRQFACHRCGQRFCKRCIGPKPHRMCMDCIRTAEGIRSKSEGIPALHNSARGQKQQPRRNLLQIPATTSGDDEGTVKASYITFRGPSGKQLQRFFVLRKDFCLYSYRSDQDACALAMLPLSGCDVGVHQQQPEKFGINLKHMNRAYVLTCINESEHAEWLAALLLSANAKLPGEQQMAGAGDMFSPTESEDGQSMKKSATIGFSAGRNNPSNSVHKKQQPTADDIQKQMAGIGDDCDGSDTATTTLSPLSSIVRRSASMGDERLGQLELAMARERVRELNARNAVAAQQQLGQLKLGKSSSRREATENGCPPNTTRDNGHEDGMTFRF